MDHPLLRSLASIPDTRSRQGRSYRLDHVLAVVVLAKLSEADSLRSVAAWAEPRRGELNRRLGLGWTRTPKKSGIAALLARVAPQDLAGALGRAGPGSTVHADGKALRGEGAAALSVLDSCSRLCLARAAYGPGGEEAALRGWIESGAADGPSVTADAAHCRKKRSKRAAPADAG